jgi:hypothetical protein
MMSTAHRTNDPPLLPGFPPSPRSVCFSLAPRATFDPMRPSSRSLRETPSRPLVRLAALLMLSAFLVGQSWMFCAPLCLIQGHAPMSMASASMHQSHTMPCHSDQVIESPAALAALLATMLPSQVASMLTLPRLVAVSFAPVLPVQLQQLPPRDPPPPRSL